MNARRVGLVTGAAHGIGAGIARRLVADGLAVGIVDVDEPAAAGQAAAIAGDDGSRAFAAPADVTDAEAVRTMVEGVVAREGRIDVLVNCAGILGLVAPFREYPLEEWRRIVDVDLFGTVNCTRAVVPHMLDAGWGRVVNIASISGKEGNPRMTAYAAAKAGVLGFTKALGRELAQTGVLVNAVAPGGVGGTNILGPQPLDYVSRTVPDSPIGRNATVEEVAAMVSWLCSDECSYNAGAVFDLSGGRASY
jgi:NAD(P)-dependent dehydrogenase (short-subunit alcohol dehydrogenase family)